MYKLYQEELKNHSSFPIGLDEPIDASHCYEGFNASCGDEVIFSLRIEPSQGKITNISFSNDSCAICTASASILCEQSIGKTKKDIEIDYEHLKVILNNGDLNEDLPPTPLEILAPVGKYPSRINCSLLPWQTVLKAFDSPVMKYSKNDNQ